MVMTAKDVVPNPEFSPFTKELFALLEGVKKLGYTIENEFYSQGEQSVLLKKGEWELRLPSKGVKK